MASPPKFLKLESDTNNKPTPHTNKNQNLIGTIKLKIVNDGLRAAKNPIKAEMLGSAPTFGIGIES